MVEEKLGVVWGIQYEYTSSKFGSNKYIKSKPGHSAQKKTRL